MASAISSYVLAMAPCSCARRLNNSLMPASFFKLAFAVRADFLVGFVRTTLSNCGMDELPAAGLARFLTGWGKVSTSTSMGLTIPIRFALTDK